MLHNHYRPPFSTTSSDSSSSTPASGLQIFYLTDVNMPGYYFDGRVIQPKKRTTWGSGDANAWVYLSDSNIQDTSVNASYTYKYDISSYKGGYIISAYSKGVYLLDENVTTLTIDNTWKNLDSGGPLDGLNIVSAHKAGDFSAYSGQSRLVITNGSDVVSIDDTCFQARLYLSDDGSVLYMVYTSRNASNNIVINAHVYDIHLNQISSVSHTINNTNYPLSLALYPIYSNGSLVTLRIFHGYSYYVAVVDWDLQNNSLGLQSTLSVTADGMDIWRNYVITNDYAGSGYRSYFTNYNKLIDADTLTVYTVNNFDNIFPDANYSVNMYNGKIATKGNSVIYYDIYHGSIFVVPTHIGTLKVNSIYLEYNSSLPTTYLESNVDLSYVVSENHIYPTMDYPHLPPKVVYFYI